MSSAKILLTIDFDPPSEDSPQVLAMEHFLREILPAVEKRRDLKFVVFCTGRALVLFKEKKSAFEIFREFVASGLIELGNHTYSHRDITGKFASTKPLTCTEQEDEILRQSALMEEIFSNRPMVFRGPFFNYDEPTGEILAKNGIKFNLSGYIKREEFQPTQIIEESTSYGNVLRIPANLKLSPKEWKEFNHGKICAVDCVNIN